MKKSLARNNLLPNKAAVYASPENMEKYNEIRSVSDIPLKCPYYKTIMSKLLIMLKFYGNMVAPSYFHSVSSDFLKYNH